MEVMEDGNLMDRVRILLQRDMAYYQERQSVLHETLCSGVVGGLLDFPHYASFAAYKLVLWWEEEYQAAFRKPSGLLEGGHEVALSDPSLERGCGGVAKTSAPKEFVQLTAESGAQILEHLHALSQEALDHADLTVLAATLGAAALLRSCLWCYHQLLLKSRQDQGLSLHESQKQFHSMAEALAERLLDLHCRLLSLYVIQDADSLNWESTRPFFEGERGSVTVQMWWLYMQGTRTDLWNTVPPRTAQRVFAGMLNESLTILTVRYATAEPSMARAPLLCTDLVNMLLCVRELAVSVCGDAAELVGLTRRSKISRDLHAKCHELLCVLLLRGCPLDALFRAFRHGLTDEPVFAPLQPRAPAPWIRLVSPNYFPAAVATVGEDSRKQKDVVDLENGPAISLELSVLLAQPQPSWALLLRVLTMRQCRVAALILRLLIVEGRSGRSGRIGREAAAAQQEDQTAAACGRFLCGGDCFTATRVSAAQAEEAVVHVVATVGGEQALRVALIPALAETTARWGGALDRGQVWNERRAPWVQAFIAPLKPMLKAVVDTVISAIQAGAPQEELLPLALSCLAQLAPCLPPWLDAATRAMAELLPADVRPAGGSVLLQLVLMGLYSTLSEQKELAEQIQCGVLAESLCSLDEDPSLHANVLDFLQAAHEYTEDTSWDWRAVEESLPSAELLVSKILLTTLGRQALKVLYKYVQRSAHWLLSAIGREGDHLVIPNRPLLHTMFHIGNRQFDQYLAGTWSPDWAALLTTALGLTREKVWKQLQRRPEFSEYKSDPKKLSHHDMIVVRTLTSLFTQEEQTAARSSTSILSKPEEHPQRLSVPTDAAKHNISIIKQGLPQKVSTTEHGDLKIEGPKLEDTFPRDHSEEKTVTDSQIIEPHNQEEVLTADHRTKKQNEMDSITDSRASSDLSVKQETLTQPSEKAPAKEPQPKGSKSHAKDKSKESKINKTTQ